MKIVSGTGTPEKLTPEQRYVQRQARRRGLIFGGWVSKALRDAQKEHETQEEDKPPD